MSDHDSTKPSTEDGLKAEEINKIAQEIKEAENDDNQLFK